MAYLLDTHVLVWLLSSPNQLSHKEKQIIQNPSNRLYYSPLSFSEMAIKVGNGKLVMADNWQMIYAKLLADKDIQAIHQSW